MAVGLPQLPNNGFRLPSNGLDDAVKILESARKAGLAGRLDAHAGVQIADTLIKANAERIRQAERAQEQARKDKELEFEQGLEILKERRAAREFELKRQDDREEFLAQEGRRSAFDLSRATAYDALAGERRAAEQLSLERLSQLRNPPPSGVGGGGELSGQEIDSRDLSFVANLTLDDLSNSKTAQKRILGIVERAGGDSLQVAQDLEIGLKQYEKANKDPNLDTGNGRLPTDLENLKIFLSRKTGVPLTGAGLGESRGESPLPQTTRKNKEGRVSAALFDLEGLLP